MKKEKEMKILVGYDGTSASKDALKLAIQHAKAFQAEVHVAYSVEEESEKQAEQLEKAKGILAFSVDLLNDNDIPCTPHLLVRELDAGADLVKFAHENKVDEIIVGVRRRSPLGKMVFGSTAQYVILGAPCPVVSVK